MTARAIPWARQATSSFGRGDWVASRVGFVCAVLLVGTVVACAALVWTAHGTLDRLGRPVGTDFSDVYAAGWMADHGQAAAAWDWPSHYRVQQAIHRTPTVPFYGWHYPPPFLLLAAPLAALPYLAALALWQGTTLAGAVLVGRRILPGRRTVLAILAAPATFLCLGHGQNAFLTAGLLGGGLSVLDRRPWLAGVLLGCLAYKPQFALALPVALLAHANRRALLGAGLSAACLVVATLAVWGSSVWRAFFKSLPRTRAIVVETGQTGWEKIVSPFAAARALHAAIPLAYLVQGAATAGAVLTVAVMFRRAAPATRNATLCCAALVSTPYALDYDLVVLGTATLFLVADARGRGWLSGETSLLGLTYLAPLVGRTVASATLVPLDLTAVGITLAVALRRGWWLDRKGMTCRPGRPTRPGSPPSARCRR